MFTYLPADHFVLTDVPYNTVDFAGLRQPIKFQPAPAPQSAKSEEVGSGQHGVKVTKMRQA